MGPFVPQQHCTILKALATHTAGIRSFLGRSQTRCCEHDVCLSQSIICSFKAWKAAKGKGCGLENCSSDSWVSSFKSTFLAVQKADYSWAHYCDPCREVTPSSALAATTLAEVLGGWHLSAHASGCSPSPRPVLPKELAQGK